MSGGGETWLRVKIVGGFRVLGVEREMNRAEQRVGG